MKLSGYKYLIVINLLSTFIFGLVISILPVNIFKQTAQELFINAEEEKGSGSIAEKSFSEKEFTNEYSSYMLAPPSTMAFADNTQIQQHFFKRSFPFNYYPSA